ncbi:MAG: glycosyl transferase family 1 [Sphingomonas bacterium]|uniref:glycosyltransferase family 4 protein n=1 Tax=Sphingomonas bacterium TaxID=1895847 RepID=UPI00262904FE|nr:glycosyltransferase family 1 protein [Sphingomonas bacterium]MDB5706490.1 glycosyl transferase family 1 [Sphingomonas bacterium]
MRDSTRLRVALFSGNYNYVRDGANQALNRLVGFLGEMGMDVRVYSPTSDTPAFAPVGTLVPVPSVAIPGRPEYRLALGLARDARRDLEHFRPDIVHLSAPDMLGTRAQTWARRRGIPIVASLHTRFESYFDYYGLGWARRMVEAHLRRFYRRSDMVLVPNHALVEEMAGLRGDRGVRLWGRGVDTDLFGPHRRDPAWRRSLGYGDDEVVILFFGRLVLEKGVAHFAETIRALRRQGRRVRPLIVGEGPARPVFEALGDVVLTGHLDGPTLGRAIASADILLTPSTTEAFGNVVLEAMAAGLAIVSADAPSARALLTDGVEGLLCSPGRRDAYVEATARLLDSPDARRRLAAAARWAAGGHDWASTLHTVADSYEVVRGRPARTAMPGQPGLPIRPARAPRRAEIG